ncbi:hypothetical protein [Salegentibacter chungangensis]|uniref:Uncharacterized protein n=1 Tax=Salegentibacter chungangensis TaxID=1335724 RepID=A0ABW3NQB7_9FLAO
MKYVYFLFSSMMLLGLVTGCGSNKELQERAPAQFQEVYFSTDDSGVNLYIPVAVIQDNRVKLESVYFKGMKSDLAQDEEQPNLYVANFGVPQGDFVMSDDPKEEYGNKAPQKPEKSPFEIDKDEAILVFTQAGKTKYYKLTGITEKN